MDYRQRYEAWLNDPLIEEKDREELRRIASDTAEIEDRFYQDLEFGTAGLRGKLGIGTNRMNQYVIKKVTQGLADFINTFGAEAAARGVAIAYDCRHYSREFSETAAAVLAANGIRVYLFDSLRPTPELSFTVRHLGTISGIVVTASHNPKEYNGYKVYWEDGAQIVDEIADPLTRKIRQITGLNMVKIAPYEELVAQGKITIIGEDIDKTYLDRVRELTLNDADIDKSINVVYTPLNGTGNIPVRRILRERGFQNIHVVPEQEMPDGDFPTVGYPNPEDTRAFAYAEALGKKVKADLLLATDPDCDRLAIMAKDKNGNYRAFNGNQTGALLIYYILSSKKNLGLLPQNGAIIKSIVTGDMGRAIAADFGVETFETLTGFKNICGKIRDFEENGQYTYLFGYEESIGYNMGDFVRDKDAVQASMMLVEMAAYYRQKGKNLVDLLEELFEKYGYFREKLISLIREGIEGKQLITEMMRGYRGDFPKTIGNSKLIRYLDYQASKEWNLAEGTEQTITDIPKSNVLRFFFDDGSWYALRPSGTEPKIKLYMYTTGKTAKAAEDKLKQMEEIVFNKLESFEKK